MRGGGAGGVRRGSIDNLYLSTGLSWSPGWPWRGWSWFRCELGSWDELWSIFQLIAVNVLYKRKYSDYLCRYYSTLAYYIILDYLRINTSCMVCVCMYMYVCVYVRIYMYIYICRPIYIYIYIYIYICYYMCVLKKKKKTQ